MCSLKLSSREAQIVDLVNAGKSPDEICEKLGIKKSTYYSLKSTAMKKYKELNSKVVMIKKKDASATKKKSVSSKSITKHTKCKNCGDNCTCNHEETVEVKRCRSFSEFKDMMSKVKVHGTTLKDRVAEFKVIYCKACIYPSRCNECPTKVLMEKYLY